MNFIHIAFSHSHMDMHDDMHGDMVVKAQSQTS